MASPITGPYTKNTQYHGSPTPGGYLPTVYNQDSTWYRQKRPYDRPLAYDKNVRRVVSFVDQRPSPTYAEYTTAPGIDTTSQTLATNKAYSKLVESVGSQSMWLVNLAERNQALGALVKRFKQLTTFAVAVKRGRFVEGARDLGLIKSPRSVSRSKSFADNFLEFHFGWEPLVKDVGALVETLTQLPQELHVHGKGRVSEPRKVVVTNSGTSSRQTTTTSGDTSVKMSAVVSVFNPNLFLLSQLGFINPAAVAWELVPFSFVVDWFTNVGQVLNSWSDLAGLTIKYPYTTTIQRRQMSDVWVNDTDIGAFKRGTYMTRSFEMFHFSRVLALTGPALVMKPFKGFSVVRGTTAVALLLQQLNRR